MLISFLLSIFFLHTSLADTTNNIPFLVILDPGHGGDDTGAIHRFDGKTLIEKDTALQLSKQTASLLRERGIPAILTRTTDVNLSLDQRTTIANSWAKRTQQAIFISIHANSSHTEESSGIETYVFNASTNEASNKLAEIENGRRIPNHDTLDLILTDLTSTANHSDSVGLACFVQQTVMDGLRNYGLSSKNRGVKQALFYVLMQTRMPSILFEPGFSSNPQEFNRLQHPMYQYLVARELVNGILKWQASKNLLAYSSSSLKTNTNLVSAIQKTSRCRILR